MLRHASRALRGRWTRRDPAPQCRAFLTLDTSPILAFSTLPEPQEQLVREATPVTIRDGKAGSREREAFLSLLIDHTSNPHIVWARYSELCSNHGPDKLTLEQHQKALRLCVPPSKEIQTLVLGEARNHNIGQSPYKWEYRLQAVVRWIRAVGHTPDIKDYNFILEQCAAAGHIYGARDVFHELTAYGVNADYRTYGLCLKAAAHRLNLPCPILSRTSLVQDATRLCLDLLKHMTKKGMKCTSINLDLCMRVLKETLDVKAFEEVLRVGYGIDTAYPDRALPESLKLEVVGVPQDIQALTSLSPIPFSTSALTTTIDMFGRGRQISRMISTFETLTKPIATTNKPGLINVEDDDEEPHWVTDRSSPPAPWAPPNVTTYNFLIKHCARAGNVVLARHYILEAVEIDMQVDRKLRDEFTAMPISDPSSPSFAVNRGTFVPMLGLLGRNKHLPLGDWLIRLCRQTVSRKYEALACFEDKSLESYDLERQQLEEEITVKYSQHGADSPDIFFHKSTKKPRLDHLEIQLDAPPVPLFSDKPFDVSLHTSILRRDIAELSDLQCRAEMATCRLSQRIAERLRRRVWNGRNIYLVSTGTRTQRPRESWRDIKSRREIDSPIELPLKHNSEQSQATKGSAYFSHSYP